MYIGRDNHIRKMRNLNIIIATHVFATGPAQELELYLKNKVNTLIFIGHPFLFAKERRSFYRVYKYGKIMEEKKARDWKMQEIAIYLKDILYTLVWIFKSNKKYDLYIGADPLNALAGIILKKSRLVNKVILYTIDYVPKRFNNSILNFLYHWLDGYCVTHSDQVWNLSQRMIDEREKSGIINNGNQKVVPIGVNYYRIKRLPIEKINRKYIVFMGHLREYQGLELIFSALSEVIVKIPDVKLIIVGTGHLEDELRNMAKKLGLAEHIEFKGFIEDHRDVEKILAYCAVGLAFYDPDPRSFTRYTDPSKPKQYMACGLPIIITRVPWVAVEIEKRTAGVVISYNRDEFKDAVIKLLTDDNYYKICRKNAIKFASELDWEKIFDDSFSKLCD
jgi:glycosyltransferase involved in cell wall biosynthesis